jgi:type 1 glutamine amidotransferase
MPSMSRPCRRGLGLQGRRGAGARAAAPSRCINVWRSQVRITFPAVVALLVAIGMTSSALIAAEPTPEVKALIAGAAPDKPPARPQKRRHLLVFTLCRGFAHGSIPTGAAAMKILGEKSGAFTVTESDDIAVFAPDRLSQFDGVCLMNCTGELFLPADFEKLTPEEQNAARERDQLLKKSLLDFVNAGKGLVGIHAATDCFYKWPEFGEMMGGYFDGHPWSEEVTVRVDEPTHPLNAAFGGQPFVVNDEIYQFKAPYSRDRLRVLLSLDPARTNMFKRGINRTDEDFAVSWVRPYGTGRVFYCSLGHRDEIFWNPQILQHYLAGTQFALGDLPAEAAPVPRAAAESQPGWITLFDGRDLTGWTCKSGAWAVEEGSLVRRGGGDIWTEQQFGDFVLELEFKVSPGANSGVFFRTADTQDCVQTGIEMQVLDSYGKPAVDKHDCGAIYDCLAPAKNVVKAPGEWNTLRLAGRGPRIHVLMNGEPIIDMNLDEWKESGQNPDGTPNKFRTAYKDMPRAGYIGFQDHGSPVWYRNVRIRPLPASR